VIGLGPSDALDPAQPAAADVLPSPTVDIELDSATQRRRVVWFDDPDSAYLAAAAIRRYLDATVVSDVIMIPTERGPALEIPADAASLRVLKAIIVRFGGQIGRVE
jgi:hypothetical protein